jgi:uncharacterized protein YndB with AHSA1/START domain
MQVNTDRIERRALLQASRARVWKALTDPDEFGDWFGVRLYQPFAEQTMVGGRVAYPGLEHRITTFFVVRFEPERQLAWRWHPDAADPWRDYSREAATLVEFTLDDAADGTALTITESGFDRLPLDRRASALRVNNEGWTQQLANLTAHLAASRALE